MILGIESSCDESALAVFDPVIGMVIEKISSQVKLHAEYGGVVPALSSREHLQAFDILLQPISRQIDFEKLIQIAVTYGPGLAGCLALGVAVAQAIGIMYKIPIVGINHLRGHAYSPFIPLHAQDPKNFWKIFEAQLPHLGLIVSGGNTVLFEIEKDRSIKLLAETVDDAAGEALDKGAKLLGMPYPGGALIEEKSLLGDAKKLEFPKAFKGGEMKFSYSGLKTSLRYRIAEMSDATIEANMADICASYQQAVIDSLLMKVSQALSKKTYKSLGLSGGVANNKLLQTSLNQLGSERKVSFLCADAKHCGDNGGMIAFAAFADPLNSVTVKHYQLDVVPNLTLT